MLLANSARRFLACCWQYISSMLFTMAIRLQSSCALCCGNGTWHCLCWHSFAGGNTSDSTCDTVKCQEICNALCGWLWAVVLKLPRVPDCFQLSDSLTWSDYLIFYWLSVLIFFQEIWIRLRLGGPQSASAADVRSFWLCQVPPQQTPKVWFVHGFLLCSLQARSYSGQRLSGKIVATIR